MAVVRNFSKRTFLGGTVSGAALLFWLAAPLIPESSPVARGAEIARANDCIECHGQPKTQYPDDSAIACADSPAGTTHPKYQGNCRDLLAYFESVRLKRTFNARTNSPDQSRLLQGEILARKYNCFNCHGELGQGGFRNAGALKGYVPGYFGNDFAALTRGGREESVQAWISQGIDPELIAHPVKGQFAEFFISRQEVSMPEFGTVPDAQIRMLTEYVIALHEFGEMDAKSIRIYSQLTQLF